MQLRRVPLDLREVVRDAVDSHRAQAQERRVDLTLEVPRALPLVLADRERLTEAVVCLLGIALLVVPEGGHVAVQVEDRGQEVAVVIACGGPGAEPWTLSSPCWRERLGRRVKRAGGSDWRAARRIVEGHGGRIWAEPTTGGGVTVGLALPAAEVA